MHWCLQVLQIREQFSQCVLQSWGPKIHQHQNMILHHGGMIQLVVASINAGPIEPVIQQSTLHPVR